MRTSAMAAAEPTPRIPSVDALRGAVMVVMALDHVRDYFGAFGIDPTDPAGASVPLFLTRWITHFCAPVFFLLTGASAYLSSRHRTPGELARFLATRGLWLLVLETVLLRCLGWQLNFDFRVTLLFVLWALGWSMLTLAVLVRWPPAVAGAFGSLLIVGHNLLDGVRADTLAAAAPIWRLLHEPGLLVPGPHAVLVAYPLVPWIGVTALGYAVGRVLAWDAPARRALLLRAGVALTLAFVAVRALNGYGDPQPWTAQRTGVRTLLSFVDTTKYPPSLSFLLMTLGPALLALCALDGGVPRWLGPVAVLGRVPLCFFILHVPLIHALAVLACWQRYGTAHWMFESPTPDRFPFTPPPGWGYPLAVVYGVWLLVVLLLWPACRWYASARARRRAWWMRYV